MTEIIGSGVRETSFKFQNCHFLATWTWAPSSLLYTSVSSFAGWKEKIASNALG